MGKKEIRILVAAPLGVGGISNLMIDIQKNIDRNLINFDYLTLHDRKEPQEDVVLALGSNKYAASADDVRIIPLRFLIRLFKIRKICKENNIEIFHYNEGTPKGILNVLAAKAGGVRYVTYHSHNGGMTDKSLLTKLCNALCKPLIPMVCDDMWACSRVAAEFTFPKSIANHAKYHFMPNAIDIARFKYDEVCRLKTRKELGVNDKFVVGHAGRFNRQKNHLFLIDIFNQILLKNRDSVLLLFGVGETQQEVREKVKKLGIENNVVFMGASDEMEKMYQAMDVFLMPSLFEGLPVTGVEAQATGLPIVFSDTITREVAVSPNITFVSLSESAEHWADETLKYRNSDSRQDYCDLLCKAGFEHSTMIKDFEKYYLEVANRISVEGKHDKYK